ncbi:MAG: SH3 domain-containing protein [Clostridiales bacterium]|nr:SH3 domain-containing protein [Clostridiales bacterium]
MKRKLAFILAVLIVVCIATAATAYTTMYVFTSNGNPLNMRDAPSMLGNIMTQIPNGAAVLVNDTYDETWYSVTYNGYTGYSMARYLVSGAPTPAPTWCPVPTATPSPYVTFPNEIFFDFQPTYYTALVRPSNPAGYVNLRWAPSLQAEIHSHYYANAVLTVMSQNSLWCQVLDETGRIMGFMMRQFLYPYYGDS